MGIIKLEINWEFLLGSVYWVYLKIPKLFCKRIKETKIAGWHLKSGLLDLFFYFRKWRIWIVAYLVLNENLSL